MATYTENYNWTKPDLNDPVDITVLNDNLDNQDSVIYGGFSAKADKTVTASGETLALVPTSEGRALLHTAYGMSVQNGTPTPSSPIDIVSAKANFTITHGQDSATVTTDLTLRAIEVTSSDDYNLVRDNKYYIADTLDYSEDDGFVVTRRIKRYTIDSSNSSDITVYGLGTATQRFSFSTDENINSNFISNRFVKVTGDSTWGGARNNASFNAIIMTDSGQNFASLADMQTWVDSNTCIFDFELKTPTTEAITTAQALALLGLKTYDESTTITSQAKPSCTIAVEYAKERLGALALTAYNTAKGNDLRITAWESVTP